jgi:hypothetical protein
MIMKTFNLSQFIQGLAIFTILGILATVSISLWVTYNLNTPLGPIAIANSPNQDLYIATGRQLFILNNQGQLIEQISFAELGAFDKVTDIAVPKDNELIITDIGQGTVFRCDLTRKHCQPALFKEGKNRHIYFDAIRFVQAPHNGFMYVADISQHIIDRYDNNGYYQETLTRAETDLLYPNDLWMTKEGLLVVTDTNHHRIVAFDTENLNFSEPVWEFVVKPESKQADTIKQADRIWPIALAQAFTGDWWIVNGDGIFFNNDVVVFDPNGNALRRIPLANSEPEPISLAPTEDAMIVVDQRNLQLLAVPYDEYQAIYDFGEARFKTILATLQTEHQSWIRIRQFAWGVLVIFVCLVIVVVYLEQGNKNLQNPLPKTVINKAANHSDIHLLREKKEIHWIYPNKLLIWGQFLLISVFIFLGLPILIGENFSFIIIDLLIPKEKRLIIGTVMPVWLMILYFTYISTQSAIGTDGHYIWLSDHNRRIFQGLPTDVVYTEEVLMLREMLIRFRGELYFPFYSSKEIKQYILPLLEPVNKSNNWQVQWQLLKQGNFNLFLQLLVTVIIIVLAILMIFYRFFA